MKVSSVVRSVSAVALSAGLVATLALAPTPTPLVAAASTVPVVKTQVTPVANVLTIAGTKVKMFGITLVKTGTMEEKLQGVLCQAGNTCVALVYPASMAPSSVPKGVVALGAKLGDGSGTHWIISAYSQGATVVNNYLKQVVGTPNAPDPDRVTFILTGNPNSKNGGISKIKYGSSAYSILDVKRQYDLWADFPDKPNFWAVANVLAGMLTIHTDYNDVDINSPSNWIRQTGNTTEVLIPTEVPPVLKGLLGFLLSEKTKAKIKAKIDAGYDRTGYVPSPGHILSVPPVNSAPEESVQQAVTLAAPEQGADEQSSAVPAAESANGDEQAAKDATPLVNSKPHLPGAPKKAPQFSSRDSSSEAGKDNGSDAKSASGQSESPSRSKRSKGDDDGASSPAKKPRSGDKHRTAV